MSVEFLSPVKEKLLQYVVSVSGGLLIAFEASINFFIPCLIAVLLDVVSAVRLSQRMHKKEPEKYDGKFKSEYKDRFMMTMIIMISLIILANYVDLFVLESASKKAVRFAMGGFLIYEGWSILENWSSGNDNKVARALQRIMVDKAERHLGTPLSDILLPDDKQPEITNNQKEEKTDGGL